MQRFDVVIVGGGPAGSTLACRLAQLGRSAIVLEKEHFPRFHVGEALLPRSMEVLRRIGVEDELNGRFLPKYGARFLCSTTLREARYRFDEAFDPQYDHAFQVNRADFDHLLLRRARALGAEVREGFAVKRPLLEGQQVVGVEGDEAGEARQVWGSLVVDASGRDTLFASRQRTKTSLPGLDKTALFAHFQGVSRDEGVEGGDLRVVLFEHGWMWLIPLRGEVTSVGVVVSSQWMKRREEGEALDAFFHRTLRLSPWYEPLLSKAERVSNVRSAADFSYRTQELAGNGWLLLGDAGGFLDPIFSTGAHLAIKGADLAALAIDQALATGQLSRASFLGFERAVREATELFYGLVTDFYEGELKTLLFEGDQRRTLRKLVTTLLSGDVFHGDPKPPWVAWVRARYPANLSPTA